MSRAAGVRESDLIGVLARLGATTSGSSFTPGGRGKVIPPDVRSDVEHALGHDFLRIRIHEGSTAAAFGATAFTQGDNVHFELGKYSPRSLGGRRLLTHELAHVVQQRSGRVALPRGPGPCINTDPVLEAEADNAAKMSLLHARSAVHRVDEGTRGIRPARASTPKGDSQRVMSGAATGPIQLNRHKKRFLNVITLGIRKAVTAARKRRAAQAQPAVEASEEVADPLDQFIAAYGKSRYYHQTDQKHHADIEEQGLLNQDDRVRHFGHDILGMSSIGGGRGEFGGDERKGVFLGPKKFMQDEKMTKNLVRTYLPKERTKRHKWQEEAETPAHEMFADSKYPGAWITKNSIPAGQTTTRPISSLLEGDNLKMESILDAVGTHYEGSPPAHEEMAAHLQEAIRRRRLSDAAMDDVNPRM